MKGENHIKLSFEIQTTSNEWVNVSGSLNGISQSACFWKETDGMLTWNDPFDVTFQGTNPFGWPQIVITALGHDRKGDQIHLGYGSAHLPTVHGAEEIKVHLYTPQPSTGGLGFLRSFFETKSNVANPKDMMVKNEGRETTKVKNIGYVLLKVNTTLRNMSKHGYHYNEN